MPADRQEPRLHGACLLVLGDGLKNVTEQTEERILISVVIASEKGWAGTENHEGVLPIGQAGALGGAAFQGSPRGVAESA